MVDIEIPFSREMAEAALAGRKIATTRSIIYGDPGDIFSIEGVRFMLVEVMPVPMYEVRARFYRLEGFSSPEEFEQTWRDLHRNVWRRDSFRYTHFFARCP